MRRGQTVPQVSRKLGVTEQTYYRWRKEYGGMQESQAKRLKELEQENSQLKRLVADLNLDKLILEEAARKLKSEDVLYRLSRLFMKHGVPDHIRSGNAHCTTGHFPKMETSLQGTPFSLLTGFRESVS